MYKYNTYFCFNSRSQPIITRSVVVKNKGQFIFESEKPNSHNELLKEISKGVKLKKVRTNDRSKPNLEGLRKFRRQMTIEEQVQKSMSQANLAASPSGVSIAEVYFYTNYIYIYHNTFENLWRIRKPE